MADRATKAGLAASVLGNVQAAQHHIQEMEQALRTMGFKDAADRMSRVLWGPLAQAETDLEGMVERAEGAKVRAALKTMARRPK